MRHEGVTAGRGQAGGEIAWEWIDDGARPEFLLVRSRTPTQNFHYERRLRRPRTAPTKPRPTSVTVVGSGTALENDTSS